jgi:phosphate transport system substrate-binding protein
MQFASDESFSPIVEEERKQFVFLYPEAHLTPTYTDDIDGFTKLMAGEIPLYFSSRDLKEGERNHIETKLDIKPRVYRIGYDGITFIVNRANKDTCISVKDVKRILSGEVKNWNEINPGSKRGEIWVCFDNKQSSTVHYCVDSILGGKPINSPNIFAAKTSKEVIEYVEKTPNAIGVIGSNWLNDKRDTTNTTFKKNITVMSVSKLDEANEMNSWKPYQVWLLNNRYPFVRTIYALLNDPRRGLPWGFAHFIEQPTGQLIILKSGLLPVRGEIMIRDVNVKSE